MNRSKIEWCDHTWNPITGCRHGCPYCYARTMSARFSGDVRLNLMSKKDYYVQEAPDGSGHIYLLNKPMINETGNSLAYPFGFQPTYHRYRMDTLDKLKMGNNIFVGAMADIFAECIPDEWIGDIISTCLVRPQHNYMFLTKNPKRYIQYGISTGLENMWFGTTITSDADTNRINSLAMEGKSFVSIEPILGRFSSENIKAVCRMVDWIIIGAETGRRKNKIVPRYDWIKEIALEAGRSGIPIFMKNSLIPIVGEANMQREFPKQLKRTQLSPKMEKKLYGVCADCKSSVRKSSMVTLLARSKRGEQPKQFGFMCKKCFNMFCQNLGLEMPELSGLDVECSRLNIRIPTE